MNCVATGDTIHFVDFFLLIRIGSCVKMI